MKKIVLVEDLIKLMDFLGLDRFQQQKCLAVWRDGNRKEAIQDAHDYASKSRATRAAADRAAAEWEAICGISYRG